MKKLISMFLLCAMIIVSLTACGNTAAKKQASVEGSIFGGKSDDKIVVDVSFDPGWITTGNSTVYNPELAQFCALLTTDSYFRAKDLDKGRQNRVIFDGASDEEYSMTSFLNEFGFADAEHYESYLIQEDPTDSNDSVTLNIGHQTVGDKYDVYAVVIRGCFSWQEWCSAFDPGCSDELYERLTGAHPDWTHKDYFKGIDVAANRALSIIQAFIAEHNDEKLPDCILITGHSRGGAIANILGAHFERETDFSSYTYTFNAMPAARADDADSYKTIFNIFDSNDFFADPFPFEDTDFCRFGIDKTLSIADSGEVKDAIAVLKGRDDYVSVSAQSLAEYRSLFAARFPNRDMLCDAENIMRLYDSKEDAEAGLEAIRTLIGAENGLGLEDLCTVTEIEKTSDGQYAFTMEYCGLTLLRSYAKILAYGGAAYDAFVNLFEEDALGCQIASWIVDNADGINGGHLMANSYILAGAIE